MTILDAFALIAFLTDEPAADLVEAELRDRPMISAVNWAEVVDHLVRVTHLPETSVSSRLEWVKSSRLTIAPVDESLGELAGLLRGRRYRKSDAAISLADCMALALCVQQRGTLATADASLSRIARAENVTVLDLPRS